MRARRRASSSCAADRGGRRAGRLAPRRSRHRRRGHAPGRRRGAARRGAGRRREVAGAAGGRKGARRRGRRVRPHGVVPRGRRGAERAEVARGRRGPGSKAHGGWKPSHFIPREPLPLLGPTPPAWRLMIARDPPADRDDATAARPRPPRRRQRRRRRRRGGRRGRRVPGARADAARRAGGTRLSAPAEGRVRGPDAIFMMPAAHSGNASRASRRRRGACPSLALGEQMLPRAVLCAGGRVPSRACGLAPRPR